MSDRLETQEIRQLMRGILHLRSPEECYAFFRDLCTANELLSLGQRFEVAKMLSDGKTYQDVASMTGASTATISRVNRCLHYGDGGYAMVLDRLSEEDSPCLP